MGAVMITDDKTGEFKTAQGGAISGRQAPRERAPWHTPVLRVLPAAEAETGVNSTTDVNATFS
jgi:hypothetical protein